MTFYLDLDNNYYLGNASFDTVNSQLESNVTVTNLHNNLANFIVTSGWNLSSFLEEIDIKRLYTNSVNNSFLLGANSDSNQRRVLLNYGSFSLNLYNDSGVPQSSIVPPPSTNRVMTIGNILASNNINTQIRGFVSDAVESNFRFVGVSTGDSLGFLHSQPKTTGNVPIARNNFQFFYLGLLENHNSSYLGNNILNRYILLTSASLGATPHSSGYYNLATETAGQNIICGKVYTPSGEVRISQNINNYYPYSNLGNIQWATNFVAYDESGNLLGTVKNLKIANGFYSPLKPIKLTGYNESGNNTWIPVGILGGKTILMRCYSSQVLNQDVTSIPLVEVFNPRYCPMDISPYYSF